MKRIIKEISIKIVMEDDDIREKEIQLNKLLQRGVRESMDKKKNHAQDMINRIQKEEDK